MDLLKIPALSSRLPLPPLSPLLPVIISLHLYLSSPSTFLNFLLLPLLFYYSILSPILYTTGSAGGDFGLGSQGIYALWTIIDKVLLSNLEKDFLRVEETEVSPAWTMERLAWSVKLYASLRGAGWNYKVKNIPKINESTASSSRLRFCFDRLRSAMILYLSMDLLSGYMRSRPYFRRAITFEEVPTFFERYFNMLCGGIAGYLAIALLYEFVVIISVGSTFWSIEECPPLFGNIDESYLISGFWSKTWHQGLRRTFSRPGQVISNSLQLSSTSVSHKIILIGTTFSLSALQHAFGTYVMARKGTGAGVFFLIQPFGILLEGLVCYLGRSIGLKRNRGWKIIGYIWTASWLLFCSPWFVDELVQAGMWEINPVPLTLYGGLMNGQFWNLN